MSSISASTRTNMSNIQLKVDHQDSTEVLISPPSQANRDNDGQSSGGEKENSSDSFAQYDSPWMVKHGLEHASATSFKPDISLATVQIANVVSVDATVGQTAHSESVEIPASYELSTAEPILLAGAVSLREPTATDLAAAADRAQQRLDRGDRAGAYLELYKVTGNEQLLLQAQITTYSGAVGGMALEGNFRAKIANPDTYTVTLDQFSTDIDQAVVGLAKDMARDGTPEGFNTLEIMKADADVWDKNKVGMHFPGNAQFIGIDGYEKRAESPGSIIAILAQDETELGRRPAEYASDPRYTTTISKDGRFTTVVNNETSRIEVFFDQEFESDRGSEFDASYVPDLEQIKNVAPSARVVAERLLKMEFLQAGVLVPRSELTDFNADALRPPQNLDRVFEYKGKLYQVDDRRLLERSGVNFKQLVNTSGFIGGLGARMEGLDYLTSLRHSGHDMEKFTTGNGYITEQGRDIAFEVFKRDGSIVELTEPEVNVYTDMVEKLEGQGLPSPYQSSDEAHKTLEADLSIRH